MSHGISSSIDGFIQRGLFASAMLATTLLSGLPSRPLYAQSAIPARQSGQDVAARASTPHRAAQPNIILILADDIGVEGVNAYGGEYYTPNIDRLARQGVRFDNAHSTPLCSPSRTRIMTGQENHRNYEAFAYLAPGQVTFGNVLRQAGYATGIVGKWQLSGNGFDGRTGITPEQAGFDESQLWQRYPLDAKGSRYWGPTRVINGRTKIQEEGFGPDMDNAFALDFIEQHKDRPFFLYYPMALVHDPFVPTPASLNAEGDKDRFAAMVTYMDKQIGAVLDKVRALGLDKNTVIIFTGDNGTNRRITSLRDGNAIRGGKGMPTVNGTHVPMIVRAPGITKAGSVSSALFDFTDVLPTLAELGHTKFEGVTDGVSQVPVLSGKVAAVRDTIFIHYAPVWMFEPSRFVFDAHWKLYGDGRFVAMDVVKGTETQQDVSLLSGEAARRYQAFRKILHDTKDGPLNPERFPMCANKPSVDPQRPATIAGCKNIGAIRGES